MLDTMHDILTLIVNYGIIGFEFIGVLILFFHGIKGAFDYATGNKLARLNLAKGMAMGLEFKLGSEILRTVIVREIKECVIVGIIIFLRAALSFLIHWEIKQEEKEGL